MYSNSSFQYRQQNREEKWLANIQNNFPEEKYVNEQQTYYDSRRRPSNRREGTRPEGTRREEKKTYEEKAPPPPREEAKISYEEAMNIRAFGRLGRGEDRVYVDGVKGPDLNKPFFSMRPDIREQIRRGMCAVCNSPVKRADFSTDRQIREYSISGMCGKCCPS